MSMVSELITLMNDSLSNKVALFNEGASKYTDQAVREAFFEILGEDNLNCLLVLGAGDIYDIVNKILIKNKSKYWV